VPKAPQVAMAVGPRWPAGAGIVRGITRYSHAYGSWDFLTNNGTPLVEIYNLRGWKGDGVIAQIREKGILYQAVRALRIPVVNVSDADMNLGLPTVIADNMAIGRLAAAHFLERGFRHFAFFTRMRDRAYSGTRAKGFREATQKAGYECSIHDYDRPSPQTGSLENEVPGMLRWIRSLPKPLAILACTDRLGQFVVQSCVGHGIPVPDEVAVVGVDNDPVFCEAPSPNLSSIPQSSQRVGYEAARLLASLMKGKPAPKQPILIPPEPVVCRRSSDALAVDDLIVAKAVRFIRAHAGEPIYIEHLLEQTGVSRSTLERRFEKAIGRSPAAEIARTRLERAKRLLVQTDMTVAQVARASGYSSASYMMTVFRKQTGTTPGEHRLRMRGKP
jgi:LacI family transcriptional regulator